METENILNQQVEKVLDKHLPKIKEIIREKITPVAIATAKNDEIIHRLLAPVYHALPLPMRLVIKEDVFMKFCFEHRNQLI